MNFNAELFFAEKKKKGQMGNKWKNPNILQNFQAYDPAS